MQVTTLSFDNMHNHGELFANMFRARHRTFIERRNWDLPEANGMEFDQYDTPASRWVAVHEFGQVLAGVRLTPTTARCGVPYGRGCARGEKPRRQPPSRRQAAAPARSGSCTSRGATGHGGSLRRAPQRRRGGAPVERTDQDDAPPALLGGPAAARDRGADVGTGGDGEEPAEARTSRAADAARYGVR